jgi:hypothetical protein
VGKGVGGGYKTDKPVAKNAIKATKKQAPPEKLNPKNRGKQKQNRG